MRRFTRAALAALSGLAAGSRFGPRQLEKGRLPGDDTTRRVTCFDRAEWFQPAPSPRAGDAAPVLKLRRGGP